ncbi:3797_t:CDS:1, partial [Entrophospora sp. SA101]
DIINNRIPREPTEEWLRIVELVKNSSAPTILPENPNRTDENTLHLESSVAPINIPVSVVVEDTKKKSKSVRISDPSSDRKKSTERLGEISTKKKNIPPVTSQETEDVLELYKRQQKEWKRLK